MTAPTFAYSGTELEALAAADNYYRWILSHFAPYLGPKVAEVGAGIGTFASFLLQEATVSEMILLEPAVNLFPVLKERFSSEPRVRVVQGYLEDPLPSPLSNSIVLINVLEHIRDDGALLRRVYELLDLGGTILLFVPALPWLYGSLDEAFEHFRRYTKSSLAGELERAGFRIECLRYMNLPGIMSWFLAGRVLKRRTIQPGQVRMYDKLVIPWARLLERFLEPPIGQSIIAVGRKQEN